MLNRSEVIGRLGTDPEVKIIGPEQTVCNFTVATSEKWKDKDGQTQEKTQWHKIVVWGRLAEVCGAHLKKGRLVFVEGKLETRSWEDAHGEKKYTTEIIAKEVKFLDSNKESGPSFDSKEAIPF